MKSDTAIEQIIGRVLRLPNARHKQSPALNRAYAFATSNNFALTARALEDALVEGNGFNPLEARDLIVTTSGEQGKLELPVRRAVPPRVVALPVVPDTSSWSAALKAKVQTDEKAGTVTFVAPLSPEEIVEAASGLVMETHREQFIAAAKEYATEEVFSSPAERSVRLAVPMFCLVRQGLLEFLDETHFLERPCSLREHLVDAKGGDLVVEEGHAAYGEVGLNEQGKVGWKFGQELADQLRLIEVTENWSEARLIDWLDRNIPHPDIFAEDSGLFIATLLHNLIGSGETPLGRLVRERFALRDLVESRIDDCRRMAKARAFQDVLFRQESGPVSVSAERVFAFDPDRYPARWVCTRSDDFQHHYHRQVGELGESGEEFECALYLDRLPEVEMWLRNLERQPPRSFWLPTSTDRFYPDFVCKLNDGRILVVEYKGEHLWSNDDSKEKRRIGELWMERSNGTCVFVMPHGRDFAAIRKAL